MRCDVCGILVGPDHTETTLTTIGSKRLCNTCLAALRKNGYLHIGQGVFLLPDVSTHYLSDEQREQLFSTMGSDLKAFLAKLSSKKTRREPSIRQVLLTFLLTFC